MNFSESISLRSAAGRRATSADHQAAVAMNTGSKKNPLPPPQCIAILTHMQLDANAEPNGTERTAGGPNEVKLVIQKWK